MFMIRRDVFDIWYMYGWLDLVIFFIFSFVIRAKEFERERRLRMRQQRIEKKKQAEEMDE